MGAVSLVQRGALIPPDAGWCLIELYHGHGFGAEAARALIDCARIHLRIHHIMTWPGPTNFPSVRTAEKVGFVRGGEIVDAQGVTRVVYLFPGMSFESVRSATISLFGESS